MADNKFKKPYWILLIFKHIPYKPYLHMVCKYHIYIWYLHIWYVYIYHIHTIQTISPYKGNVMEIWENLHI